MFLRVINPIFLLSAGTDGYRPRLLLGGDRRVAGGLRCSLGRGRSLRTPGTQPARGLAAAHRPEYGEGGFLALWDLGVQRVAAAVLSAAGPGLRRRERHMGT